MSSSPAEALPVVLVGAGGYGEWYGDVLLAEGAAHGLRLAGVVEPRPEGCRQWADFQARRIPVFGRLEDFYASGARAGLALLVSPIHFHAAQTCLALRHGSHVLCEKPLCAGREEIEAMAAAEKASGRTVSIGYQWSFSAAVQRLKADVLAGRFGRPLRLRTLGRSPRSEAYYGRNGWAGRRKSADGRPVFDSPVNNAMAHYLHNMLYVLGPTVAESAWPEEVEAEMWRANPIENYDTAALRIRAAGGVELLFYASHAVTADLGVAFSYEFERGTVEYSDRREVIVARFADGGVEYYGFPDGERPRKIWAAAEAARTGRPTVCGITAAAAHVEAVLRAQEDPAGIRDFDPAAVARIEGPPPRRAMPGLSEALERCFHAGLLPREMAGLDWPPAGRRQEPALLSR